MTVRAVGTTLRTSARRVGGTVQIGHLAGVAAIEPLAEERQLGMRGGGRDAAGVETERRAHCALMLTRAAIVHAHRGHQRSFCPTSWRSTYGRIPP